MIQQPTSSDYLNNPDHSLSHRVIANDGSAPIKSVVVDSDGKVGIGKDVPTVKLDINGDIVASNLSGANTGDEDTASITALGALMDSEVTNLAQVKAFDSSNYATSAQGSTADSAVQPTNTPVDNDFAKFTNGDTVEGRSYSEVKTDLSLDNVDNTSDSTKNSATATLTNKRITERVASTADDATAVIDCDSYDEYYLTAVANATTISVTGTPTEGQTIFIGLKDAGTTKGLTWTGITGLGVTLPTDTTAGKQHIIGIKYIASAWRGIAVNVEE